MTGKKVFPVRIAYRAIQSKVDGGPNFGGGDLALLKEPMNAENAGTSKAGCRQYMISLDTQGKSELTGEPLEKNELFTITQMEVYSLK